MLVYRDRVTNLDYSYRIFAPSGAHKSFRILKLTKLGRSASVRVPELKSVNVDYLSGKLRHAEARNLIEQIRDSLYASDGVKKFTLVFNSDNQKILADYWEDEYRPRLVRLIDSATAKAELQRSISALGAVSIRTATRNEIQDAVNTSLTGNAQRRAVSKLNALLKYLGRNIKLVQAHEVHSEVSYLTPAEFEQVVSKIKDDKIKLLHKVAFSTGMRVGEVVAMEPRYYNSAENSYKILWQIDKNGKKRKTKNRKDRTTFILPGYRKDVERWLAVAPFFDHKLRLRISRYTKNYVGAAGIPKNLKFHDLRHSYAIKLLSDGVPLSHVAQCIGDSIPVAEKFYVGFDLSSSALALINKLVRK